MNIEKLLQDDEFNIHMEDFIEQAKAKRRNAKAFSMRLSLMLKRAMELEGLMITAHGASQVNQSNEAPKLDKPEHDGQPEAVDGEAEWSKVIERVKDKIANIKGAAIDPMQYGTFTIVMPGEMNPSEFPLRMLDAGIDCPMPQISGGADGWVLLWGDPTTIAVSL